MLKFGKKAVFKYTMAKLILLITILFVNGYQVKAVSLMQGQEATLHFPYPCDSTEVTLQQSNRAPFYRSTDGSSLSLSQDQVQRFKVQNRNNIADCSLEFSISNLLRIDQGTYISIVFKDGEILVEQTHRIWLKVDYPPGKASCVVSEDAGEDLVSLDCTTNAGSISGIIVCYQNGVWIPPLTEPTETDTTLKQNILITKNQPVFCCSSPLPGYKERCECDDTALYLDDTSSSDPCPSVSTKKSTTSTYRTQDLVEKSQSSNSLNYPLPPHMTSTNANKMTKNNYLRATVGVISLILNAFSLYLWRQTHKNNNNYESRDLILIILYCLMAISVVITLICNVIYNYQTWQERKDYINDESQYLKSLIILYISAVGVVISLILDATFLYKWRKERKRNSNYESQYPSLSKKVHGDDAQECETDKLNQIQITMQEVSTHKTQNII